MREQQLLGGTRRTEIIVAAFWVVFGGVLVVSNEPKARLGIAIFAGLFALITIASFEWRRRSMKRTLARVRKELEDIAKTDLDGAVSVNEGSPGDMVTSLASNPAVARMFASRGIRYSVVGAWQGKPVELGTNIIPSRDTDTRISYVIAGPAASLPSFRAIMRGTFTTLSRIGMETHEVRTGDTAFDAKWAVDGDDALAKRVLDDAMRARLMQLLGALKWNMAHTASVESVGQSVIVRWPGELDARFASSLRDLAFDVRAKLEA